MQPRRKFIRNTSFSAVSLLAAGMVSAKKNVSNSAAKTGESCFLHGVASGDPMPTQVIIWTRVTSEQQDDLKVKWWVAKDFSFTQLAKQGEAIARANNDYTIKIDVTALMASQYYYYQFEYNGQKSVIGKTMTAPLEDKMEDLQFAVVSCSNYSAGYYNVLGMIARRNNLAAVIHLGDYIYEGTQRVFDNQPAALSNTTEATRLIKDELWWLSYYRKRYALSRTDTDLQLVHQRHAFISIWDDHEFANNACKDGAEGHDTFTDGPWEIRKRAAKKAYAEWMPLRGDATSIYRALRFGKMLDLVMLDTRIEGRDKQVTGVKDRNLFAGERTILGKEQKAWLFNKLHSSPCQWKVIGNQVIFSEINIKWSHMLGSYADKIKQFEHTLLDYWEGYPAERDEVIKYIAANNIDDVVLLSASMHCAFAFDVTLRATENSREGDAATYNAQTGKGSVAVEFAAPSITSESFGEKAGPLIGTLFQNNINRKMPFPVNFNPNPHIKFVDVQNHGYFLLKLNKQQATADFYIVDTILQKNAKEKLTETWHTKAGSNRLQNV